jgi:ribosomal protein S17E
MIDEELQNKNRDLLLRIKEKSEDDFEKNLVLITSGTLVLSMTFIEKISPLADARGVIALVIGWALLTISLLVNLISHRLSAKHSILLTEDFDAGKDPIQINKNIATKNKIITRWNNWAVGLMILGIISLVVYCSINAFHMSKSTSKQGEAVVKPNNEDTVRNGRTMSTLVIPKPDPKSDVEQAPKNTQKRNNYEQR